MVTGRPGTGKTTLAETFLNDLDSTRVLAERVAVSGLEADDLLRAVAYAYGMKQADLTRQRCATVFSSISSCWNSADDGHC